MNPFMSILSVITCLIGKLKLLCIIVARRCSDKTGIVLLARNLSVPREFTNKIIAPGPVFLT